METAPVTHGESNRFHLDSSIDELSIPELSVSAVCGTIIIIIQHCIYNKVIVISETFFC